jgi:hypothetical protein
MDCWLDGQGFGYRVEATHFSGLRNVQAGSGAQPASYLMGNMVIFWGRGGGVVKRPVQDFDHSPPSGAEGKNCWSHTSLRPICLFWRRRRLIYHLILNPTYGFIL